ncbi:MAG: hypothetical protein ACI376_08490 [Candidatus Bruticola sp.]
MLKRKLLSWGLLCTASSILWGAALSGVCYAIEPAQPFAEAYAVFVDRPNDILLAKNQSEDAELSGKDRKERKNYTSKKRSSKKTSDRQDRNTQVDFIESEDGYWNARGSNAPQFVDGGSINSVMFENRPGRRVKEIPSGPVRRSDVEITGGQSTQITVNGRSVTLDRSKKNEPGSRKKNEHEGRRKKR